MTALVETLRARLGAAHVVTEGDLTAWEVDWRRRYRGRALAVARPGTVDRSTAMSPARVAVDP